MTQKQAIALVASLGLRLRIVPELGPEYQVIIIGRPDGTYYTNDLKDAVETAKKMAECYLD